MSVTLIAVLCGAVVVLGIVFAAGVGFMKKSSAGPSPSRGDAPIAAAPRAREVTFVMRFDAKDKAYIEGIVGSGGPLMGAQVRDAALNLVRAAGDATHAFVGPSRGGPPVSARAPSADPTGIIVALSSNTTRPLDTVGDDTDATTIADALRELGAMRDDQIRGGTLAILAMDPSAGSVTLVPLRKEALPGQQICPYCASSFPAYETQCGSCGARVKT